MECSASIFALRHRARFSVFTVQASAHHVCWMALSEIAVLISTTVTSVRAVRIELLVARVIRFLGCKRGQVYTREKDIS